MGDSSQKLGNLELTAQPGAAGSATGWRVSFPSDSGLNLFQAAWPVSVASRQLVWSLSLFTDLLPRAFLDSSASIFAAPREEEAELFLLMLSGRGLVNLVSFRDFLQLF